MNYAGLLVDSARQRTRLLGALGVAGAGMEDSPEQGGQIEATIRAAPRRRQVFEYVDVDRRTRVVTATPPGLRRSAFGYPCVLGIVKERRYVESLTVA